MGRILFAKVPVPSKSGCESGSEPFSKKDICTGTDSGSGTKILIHPNQTVNERIIHEVLGSGSCHAGNQDNKSQ